MGIWSILTYKHRVKSSMTKRAFILILYLLLWPIGVIWLIYKIFKYLKGFKYKTK